MKTYEDYSGKYLTIKNGRRVTTDQPESSKRTVYVNGGCLAFGTHAQDRKTIASVLQRIFNKQASELQVKVENYGVFAGSSHSHIFEWLNDIPANPGDVVIVMNFSNRIDLPILDLSDLFRRPHDYGEVFTDSPCHVNENGYKVIAEKLFEYLKDNDYFTDCEISLGSGEGVLPIQYCYGVPQKCLPQKEKENPYGIYGKDLERFKESLRQVREQVGGKIGSIVMNCNPFTRGHRYLIEHAAQQVSHLYVFIVEEDQSIFPFQDRFELVKQGTSDMENVTILPSGKFMISALTFSDYFNKASIQDKTIDPSQDVELFAREIAPILGITIRFAGEEPFDQITRQYNDVMRRILPQYGIRFVEIPRKESNGEPISASRVRKLLEKRDFDAIADLVPETTLEYLKETHG
jgi:[citrate (pro-3S)-lyase] ligase